MSEVGWVIFRALCVLRGFKILIIMVNLEKAVVSPKSRFLDSNQRSLGMTVW